MTAISGLALATTTLTTLGPAAASSAQTPITIRITKVSEKHRAITVSGVITPAAALARDSTDKPYVVLVRREGKDSYYQLSYSNTGIVPRSGKFTLRNVKDTTGRLRRNTYGIEFDPAPSSGYSQYIFLFGVRLTK